MKKVLSLLITFILLLSISLSLYAATSEQINAKAELTDILPYYTSYADRVLLEINQKDPEFQNYIHNLLPEAKKYVSSTTYYPVSTYKNMIDKLEKSWKIWRLNMPISAGLYTQRDNILATLKDSSYYNQLAYSKFSELLPIIINLIDSGKNNYYATDIDGKNIINLLQGLVDELEAGVISTDVYILNTKFELAQNIFSSRQEIAKDTKITKSPETISFTEFINRASSLLSKKQATSLELLNTIKEFENQYNTFQSALFVGKAFINKAREEYFKVSDHADLYTPETWTKVSNAMDFCDNVKNSWHTDKDCEYAYNLLITAINNLQLKEVITHKITVSTITANAGDNIEVQVTIDKDSDMIYGNFNLMYDSNVLEYTGSSNNKTQMFANSIFLRYEDVTNPLKEAYNWTINFKIKDYAVPNSYPLFLKCEKLRDSNGALLNWAIDQGEITIHSSNVKGDMDGKGQVKLSDVIKIARFVINSDSLSEREIYLADINYSSTVTLSDVLLAAKKVIGETITSPSEYFINFISDDEIIQTKTGSIYQAIDAPNIPEKNGYIFRGWYTGAGLKVQNDTFICGGQNLYAKWEKFEPGPLSKNQIAIGAFIAISNNSYATEDDFKMIADCGIDFIILDYVHGDEKSRQCLYWAEKYGIKVIIHDYELNALSPFTEEKVKELTSAYSKSPAFAGNNLLDEPRFSAFSNIESKMNIYTKILPEYDMHVNLFPNYGAAFMGISYEDYIRRFVQIVTDTKHICQDTYPLLSTNQTRFIKNDYYEGLQVTANAAKEQNLDHWIYIQTMTGVEPDVYPDLADLRFQAYACLSYGASKIIHYCYDVPGYSPGQGVSAQVYAMRDYGHNYTKLWDYGQILHTELSVISQIYATYAYQNTSAYKTNDSPAYLNNVNSFSSQTMSILNSNTSLLIGSFEKENGEHKAYMLTNAGEPSEKQSATVTFSIPDTTNITIYNDGICEDMQSQNGIYTITIKPCSGTFITIK